MKFERKNRPQAGKSVVWLLLVIALLVLSIYLIFQRPELVNVYIPGLLATPTPAPALAPTTPSDEPGTMPETAPEATPPPSASMDTSPGKFNISSLAASEMPKTLRIASAETFEIANGKGSATARAGTVVDVVSRAGEILEISYLGGSKPIHYTKTSLANDVQAARSKKRK
jgi:hypothetical protein